MKRFGAHAWTRASLLHPSPSIPVLDRGDVFVGVRLHSFGWVGKWASGACETWDHSILAVGNFACCDLIWFFGHVRQVVEKDQRLLFLKWCPCMTVSRAVITKHCKLGVNSSHVFSPRSGARSVKSSYEQGCAPSEGSRRGPLTVSSNF